MSEEIKYYAGIGSRKTPNAIRGFMVELAKAMADEGFVLRSGGAEGADKAFETGVDYWHYLNNDQNRTVPKQIFLAQDIKGDTASMAAMNLAMKYHPAWNRMQRFAQNLHARNAFQIMGRDMKSPVKCVICWTPDGCIDHQHRTIYTGGTGTAISIASEAKIPVLNLYYRQHVDKLCERFGITV